MTGDRIIASDGGSGRVPPVQRGGWYYNWGPQAWIDMWMSNSMLVKKAMPLVSHTFVPIPVSYTHLTLPTNIIRCRSRWSAYH